MKLFQKYSLHLVAVLLTSALLWTGCQNSTSSGEDEELDPFGVALIMNGVEIAKQENSEVSYHEGDHLELDAGEETSLITVRFIDEDGDRFQPNENFSLRWLIDDEDVLEVEQHEEDGPWNFHLVGLAEGETTIRFLLWHDSGDHEDFTSLPFEVHVEEIVAGMEIQNESGETVITADGSESTGSFTINEGETSGEFIAIFLDENGEPVDLDEEYELEWHLDDSAIATVNAIEESPFSFTITGVETGETDVHFSLIKETDDDDHDHEDEVGIFESPDIVITVN